MVSKILASRLANFLPRVIDEQQFGFVKGRSIHESIALAQEMAADLDRRSEGGNIILKYDMSKAYDRLEWRFLLRAMGIMGFSTGFQDLVYCSICKIRYRVCVNGFYSQEFRSSRGVRQGDPLSPLLFIIAQQILSYNLNHRQDSGVLSPYSLGRKVKPISHLFYADDMLIFTNGRINSLQRLKQLMGRYEAASGQQINLQKSALYVSKRITRARITRIQRLTGCQAKQLPFKYLGAPIYKGRCRIQFFDETVEKFSSKIEGWHGRFLSFGGKITLLKAVLASLPTHVFSCMAIPKQVQRRIEGLMAAFLWSQNGQSRTHWVSWRKISRPIADGGLGIRSVKDTIFGLHGKLAWKILSQQSLWTRMILQKYGRDSVYEANNFRVISSSLWRNLFPHFRNLLSMSHWQVGKGAISFWRTNWIGEVLQPNFSMALTVKQGIENMDQISYLLSYEQLERIGLIELEPEEDDIMIFEPSPIGKFSVAQYIGTSSDARNVVSWYSRVRNKYTSYRVNAFMWRVFQNALPVDYNLQRKGIVLASKCVCCSSPAQETLQHLFVDSDLATTVRHYFAAKVHKQAMVHSLQHLFTSWMNGISMRSQMGYTTLGILFYGLWEIWKHRCKLKFEGGAMDPRVVIHATTRHLHDMNIICTPKRRPTRWEEICLARINIPITACLVNRGTWVSWTRPSPGFVKLNTNGSRRGNGATGGGIVRDSKGELLLAFATKFSHQDAFQAELDAMVKGLKLCAARLFNRIEVETDSELSVKMIRYKTPEAWRYSNTVHKIRKLLTAASMVQFVVRESYKVADALALWAYTTDDDVLSHSMMELPSHIRKLVFFDRIGLHSFRSKCK